MQCIGVHRDLDFLLQKNIFYNAPPFLFPFSHHCVQTRSQIHLNNQNASNHGMMELHRSSDPLLPFNTQCQGYAREEAILPLSLEQVQFHLSLPLFVCTLDCSQLTPIVQLRRELTDMSHEPSTKFSLSDKLKLKVPQC